MACGERKTRTARSREGEDERAWGDEYGEAESEEDEVVAVRIGEAP